MFRKNWINLHPKFPERREVYTKTYQEEWEQNGLTYQDAQEWILIGFTPENSYQVKQWKDHSFISMQAKFWLEKCFYNAELAAYLRDNVPENDWPNKDYAQYWLNLKYPIEGKCLRKEDKENFGKRREKIIKLEIPSNYLVGSLDFSDFINLEELNCYWNQLTSLNLNNCTNLIKLSCSFNNLSYLNLTQNTKLEELDVSNNQFLSENPIWLSQLINLKNLYLGNNNFFGSLEFTKDMTQLKKIDIVGNSFTGLEYLPLSLNSEGIGCDGKIEEEIKLYNRNLSLWQAIHPQLMKKAGKKQVIIDYQEIKPEKITNIPNYLQKESDKKKIQKSNFSSQSNLNYSSFLIRDNRPFFWEENKLSNFTKVLPTRLYQISTKQVIETKGDEHLNYCTLSYVWGDSKLVENQLSNEQKRELDLTTSNVGYSNSNKMTKLGYKAWKKAISACQFLDFDYLWIDQLCINQNSPTDKGNEVRKMGGCYGNCETTLISIDEEIGDINKEDEVEIAKKSLTNIFQSPWFTRSWTYQEGILSKQTIFMFDDDLVDGRILALGWTTLQREWENHSWPLKLNTNHEIFITPLGWSYGAKENHKVELSLGEALLSVRDRERGNPLDGVYSILGLLPYGDKVKPNYKQFGEKYTKENIEKALLEVVERAIEQGYGQDIFSWFGLRNDNFNYWCIPMIHENGSTSVEKSNIHLHLFKNIKFSLQGIELEGEVCRVDEIIAQNKKKIFGIDGQMRGEFSIKSKGKEFIFTGNPEIIDKINVGDFLVINSNETVFSISNNANYSVNLLKIERQCYIKYCDGREEYEEDREINYQNIFIDLVNKKIIFGSESISEYKELIENKNKEQELKNLLEWNNWRNIHNDFTKEIVKKWKEKNFNYEQVYNWASIFEKKFNSSKTDFYVWLRDEKKMEMRECEILNENKNLKLIKKLTSEYNKYKISKELNTQMHIVLEKINNFF